MNVSSLARDIRCRWRRRLLMRRIPLREVSDAPAMVIAPHPDDETFGCGALIALKRQIGIRVRIVFLTDGEASLKDHGHAKPHEVAEVRRRHSLEACRLLGVGSENLRRYSLADGAVPQRGTSGFGQVVERLLGECDEFRPGEIFCPHPSDGHADHKAAAELAGAAVARYQANPIRLHYYPVWFWFKVTLKNLKQADLTVAWKLDGETVYAQKHEAIEKYLNPTESFHGIPYCGKLPSSLLSCARQRQEAYFDAIAVAP